MGGNLLLRGRYVLFRNNLMLWQPCAAEKQRPFCLSKKQPYAVGQPFAAETQRPYVFN